MGLIVADPAYGSADASKPTQRTQVIADAAQRLDLILRELAPS
jgi:hypothetical protein